MPQMKRSISITNGSRAMWSDGMDSSADGHAAGHEAETLEHITYKSSMDLLAETFAQVPAVATSRTRSLDFKGFDDDPKAFREDLMKPSISDVCI